jgi:hypothetical protein
MRSLFLILALCVATSASAQEQTAVTSTATQSEPVTIEYYYRIKWGQHGEFLKLYRKNHEPLLKEMQKLGFIKSMKIDEPYTHLAGGTRWDLRVTIVYRDGTAAVGNEPGGWDDSMEAVGKKLFPDKAAHAAEESRRMGLLDEHWDVIVYNVDD